MASRIMLSHAKAIAALDPHDAPVRDTSEFPWVPMLEALAPALREEVSSISSEKWEEFKAISGRQERLGPDRAWFSLPVKIYGRLVPETAKRLPVAAAITAGIPNCRSAMFSVFKPGADLPEHTGITRGVLRVWLPLILPEGDIGLMVDGQNLRLQEGKVIVFDDFYPHAAWNRSGQDRMTLLLDIDHPLPGPASVLNRLFLNAIGRHPDAREAFRRTRQAYAGRL